MRPTISYEFGDVVLVPFRFTDQSGTKKRPAVVVSSTSYNASRPDLILMTITSQIRSTPDFGEVAVGEWQKAGLLKASVIKPVLTTVEPTPPAATARAACAGGSSRASTGAQGDH
ncbi:MAG TPA: type II toxin-antitoxin system PemK/MazF family toxin [Pyrinomonadaceae bacterium]|jgi:mRNA interferase MazF